MQFLIPDKTIERLSLYRRLLTYESASGRENIYSHELARFANLSAVQVRRDLMFLEHSGSPKSGYRVNEIIDQISDLLGKSKRQEVAIFGVGNLGKAILSYFGGKMQDLPIVAAFDKNEELKINSNLPCPIYHTSKVKEVFEKNNIEIVILAVPENEAQPIVDLIVPMGVRAIVNFAHIPLRVSSHVFVENIDIMLTIEKAAYFSLQNNHQMHELILPSIESSL
ncbi:MAG: hypothetical protein A2202_06875 [Bdellovibrionales bacterium RIFOXYA1_FULL_36_14]|nr:MAG: hypothetical protein A2202_06875 [Bdellovibrionales bacterium RIFOXYA1_FULL_36_14]